MLSIAAKDYYTKMKVEPEMLLRRGLKKGFSREKCFATMEHCYKKLTAGKQVAPWEIYKYVENSLPKRTIIPREVVTARAKLYIRELHAKATRAKADVEILQCSYFSTIALLVVTNLFLLYLLVR